MTNIERKRKVEKYELTVMQTNDNKISVINFDELKARLAGDMQAYKAIDVNVANRVEVKKTLAELRKKRKELEDKRISLKKEYDEPFNNFVSQVKELVALIDEPISLIDADVKKIEASLELEEASKNQKKREAIETIYKTLTQSAWLKFEEVFTEDMLKLPIEEIKDKLLTIAEAKEEVIANMDEDMAVAYFMSNLQYEPAFQLSSEIAKAKKRIADFKNRCPF